MKIAFVGKYPIGGIVSGPEKVAKNLFRQISKLNPDSEFITFFFKSKSKRSYKQVLFGSEKISSNPVVNRLGILQIITELMRKKVDLVHLITFDRFGFIILLLKPFLRYKIVYTMHGIYRYERELYYQKPGLLSELKDVFLERLVFAMSDKLIFLSQHMVKLAQNYYKFGESRISIIPNGVSLTEFPLNKDFILSSVLEIVFYNGLRVSRKRGLEELLNILSKSEMNNIHLSVLGNYVKTNYQQISFFPPMPENKLYEFLKTKHIFIDNLNYMPFSILALEAMALGLILIVSDESGISAFIKNGENGFVYNSKKAYEIGDILKDIAKGKYHLEMISENAVQTAKNLTWDKIAVQYCNSYEKVIN